MGGSPLTSTPLHHEPFRNYTFLYAVLLSFSLFVFLVEGDQENVGHEPLNDGKNVKVNIYCKALSCFCFVVFYIYFLPKPNYCNVTISVQNVPVLQRSTYK